MNILFSSTRQWNPGDEFIFFGIRNLVEEVFEGKKINWVLYDRNPDLFISINNAVHREKLWGNSFHNDNAKVFDLAIAAGSPEWVGKPLNGFYRAVTEGGIGLAVLGVGYIDNPIYFSENELNCFKNHAKIITVRDENAARAFDAADIDYTMLPCPALFASKKATQVKRIDKIGFILQTNQTINQSVSEELKHACIHAVKKLRKMGMVVDVICHYIDEFEEFARTLDPIRYSYDAADYIDILNDYDLIISTRLHGAVLANSLGKPAILVNAGDSRLKGGSAQFPYISKVYPDSIVNAVLKINPDDFKDVVNWKQEIKKQYITLLRADL